MTIKLKALKANIVIFIIRKLAQNTENSIPELSSILYAILGAIYSNNLCLLFNHVTRFSLEIREKLSSFASLKIH